MNKIEQLKACLPSIPDMVPNLRRESGDSLCGPCPLCGGTDRLVYKTDEQKFWCRHCRPKGGDVIDLYRLIHNKTLPELFDEFRINNKHKSKPSLKLQPEPAQKKKEEISSKKNYSQQDRWKNILNGKNTNLDPIYRLAKRRGISKELFLKAYNNNKIRFVKHYLKDQEELSSVACQYCELDGDKKVLAIQMLSVDGLSYSDTEKKNKVFTYGSENEEGCFFQVGENIEQAKIIILFESVINAFSCAECFPSACCLSIGSSIYTKKVKVLRPYRDKGIQILCFFDNDEAGRKVTEAIAILLGESLKKVVWPIDTPNKYDINDLLKANKKSVVVEMIDNAIPVKISKSETEEDGEDQIDELNKRHAVVTIGGKVRILDEKINIKGIHNIIFLSKYDFNTKYENRTIPNPLAGKKGQPKKIQLSKAWMGSPKRREYEEVVFEPQLNNDNSYNLYQGLAFSPIKGDWSKYRKHLRNNICNGDMQYYDWLFAWMARIVQKPGGKKPGTAIVLQGERGVGKGVFAEIFGKIFGNHFQLITNSKQATGRFNSALKNCILLYLDEAFYAGDKTADGVLKGLITSDQHNIELKGKDTFQMSNHVNCIIASNNDWAISAGSNERRYFVLKVAQSHMQDHKYFKAIDDQMYNKKGIAAMLYDLLELDISKYNLREAPKTIGLSEQVSLNFKSFRKFWFELLRGDFDFENIDGIISTKFYDMYIDHCDKINERYKYTDAVFGKKLTHYSHVRKEKKRLSDGQRSAFYFFNDRNSERKKFEEITKTEFDWENDKTGIDEI